jgi:hypothetical protein
VRRTIGAAAILTGAIFTFPLAAVAQSLRTITLAKQYHEQNPITARIEFASGTIGVVPGPATSLYRMQLSYDADRFLPLSRFDPATNSLRLGLERTGGGGIRVSSTEHLKQEAAIELSPQATMDLMMRLGASRAELELGGLRLSRVVLETAASRTEVRFSEPNPVPCDSMRFSVGAADFSAYHLGNSGCSQLSFEGEMGEMLLDLTGAWRTDAAVAINLALGGLTLRLPRGVGVELTVDRLFSSFESQGFVRSGNVYRSPGFDQTTRKLRIDLSCKVGGVEVEWD